MRLASWKKRCGAKGLVLSIQTPGHWCCHAGQEGKEGSLQETGGPSGDACWHRLVRLGGAWASRGQGLRLPLGGSSRLQRKRRASGGPPPCRSLEPKASNQTAPVPCSQSCRGRASPGHGLSQDLISDSTPFSSETPGGWWGSFLREANPPSCVTVIGHAPRTANHSSGRSRGRKRPFLFKLVPGA